MRPLCFLQLVLFTRELIVPQTSCYSDLLLHAFIACKAGALLLGKVALRGKYLVRVLCFFFWMQNSALRFVVVVFFLNAVRDTTWAYLLFSAERWRIVQPCFIHFQTYIKIKTKLNQIGRRFKFRVFPKQKLLLSVFQCLHLKGGQFNSGDTRVGFEHLYRQKVPKNMSGPQHWKDVASRQTSSA